MLGSFVNHGLTQEELESEALMSNVSLPSNNRLRLIWAETLQNVRLAGSDTAAGALRWILFHILTSLRVYSKFMGELTTANISRPIKDSEPRNIPYLQAIIK